MSYNTKKLVRDADNIPVSQYYNVSADAYEAVTGYNGGINVSHPVIKEVVTGSTAVTKTYTDPMQSILIINDGNLALTLVVGAIVLSVGVGETFDEYFPAFTSFTVNATTAFRAIVRG